LASCSSTDYDDAMLTAFRKAIPDGDTLRATAPAANVAAALGPSTPAFLPAQATDLVTGVNGAVGGLVDNLKAVVAIPPTSYNDDKNEFFWGPFANDDGFGTVAVFIRDTEGQGDFRYEYALLRGVEGDISTLSPVIWGAATPDAENDDYGVGVSLWDFEANRAFEEAHNPDFQAGTAPEGRFAAVYGRGADENDATAEFAFVVAVFRNFVDPETANPPADLDYFYGQYKAEMFQVDFLHFIAEADVDDDRGSLSENLAVRMAFLNGGEGRGEAEVSGGSVGEASNLTECWDAALSQTYFAFQGMEFGSGCTSIFTMTLDELMVPRLEDIDPAIREKLEDVAENGVP
jgi:hypothetical protein